MPQAAVQGGSPVMMAPTYMDQMGTAKAPVMLMPVQTMQQMPGTSGNGLMYVQVPSGSTQGSTPPQVPQVTIHPSEAQSSGDVQVRYILNKVCLKLINKGKCGEKFPFSSCLLFYFIPVDCRQVDSRLVIIGLVLSLYIVLLDGLSVKLVFDQIFHEI